LFISLPLRDIHIQLQKTSQTKREKKREREREKKREKQKFIVIVHVSLSVYKARGRVKKRERKEKSDETQNRGGSFAKTEGKTNEIFVKYESALRREEERKSPFSFCGSHLGVGGVVEEKTLSVFVIFDK